MNRVIDYIIDEAGDGLRIEQYLRRKGYSGQNLAEIKRMPKSVLVNGEHYYMKQKLNTGDHLSIHICETKCSEKIPPVQIPLDIVYEDEDIIVINKQAGMPIHPSLNNYMNSMANALAWYYQEQGKPFIFRCCNRLDRDTSGLTVVAKHLVSGNILSDMVRRRDIHREYLAIVRGHVSPEAGTINAPLARKPGTIIERTVDWEQGETAITHYRLVEERNGHSLISLRLETGRTHQIRIHMKYLGYPLIGDYLYNPDMEYIGRQALHSHRLSFTHPITGKPMEFTAPLPKDMEKVLI
ncbi:RluA family pseudouridine synthase [Faecalicatena contorta]|uniref:RluA family pseudouridine synthase n=1 Tax=Faecalicatena contorta TaxID=39482 RepID=UPI001F260026|nr:RluA family pseudouridine synthase [Faecalicatena contorta]MCF2667997.1 RluA family pseudouridine synthase [Faecalicatena contorta]